MRHDGAGEHVQIKGEYHLQVGKLILGFVIS